jgi:hypothetical protein
MHALQGFEVMCGRGAGRENARGMGGHSFKDHRNLGRSFTFAVNRFRTIAPKGAMVVDFSKTIDWFERQPFEELNRFLDAALAAGDFG